MGNSDLEMFMQLKSISPDFIDAWGEHSTISIKNIYKLINAMGFDTSDETSLKKHYLEEEKKHWLSLLPKVCVFQKDHENNYTIEVCLPIDFVTDPLIYKIKTESGKTIKQSITATDFPLIGINTINDIEFQCYEIVIQAELPFGYHSITLLEKGNQEPLAVTPLMICPPSCYIPENIHKGKKIWGPSVQLYCLKSDSNWGVGDFSDLKELIKDIAKNGGDFVGLNPIHALFPAEPEKASPYSPSSRNWLNIIYIDITNIEEFAISEKLQNKIKSDSMQSELLTLRENNWVDYQSVTELKIEALRELFTSLNKDQKSKKRLKEFLKFVKNSGESLKKQASYDALLMKFIIESPKNYGWEFWPEEFQSYKSKTVKKWCASHKEEILFWSYCQWVAQSQLDEAFDLANELGMNLGIYRDLAVGVTKNSSEIWGNKELYCTQISIGAPPDVLGPLGQNWGLPTISPMKLEESGYQQFIELLKTNMRSCGALRIDHVIGLLRQWWVPENEEACNGAYIYYQITDLLNILALESNRNNCLIIGEDLGTLPEGIDELLQDSGIFSYKVFFFEQAPDGGYISPVHYAKQAMATLVTHDMPTIDGFWNCSDLKLGKELSLYKDETLLQKLFDDRLFCKQQILNSLHGHNALPDNNYLDAKVTAMDQTLNFSLQKHLAGSSSSLFSIQLEDLLEMKDPVNVPGTSYEYKNWRRKLSKTTDQIFNDQKIIELLADISEQRNS